MRQIAWWNIGDTVIDVENTSRIYEVVNVVKKKKGVWITLKNVVTESTYSAFENHFLNQPLIGYRKDTEVQIYG